MKNMDLHFSEFIPDDIEEGVIYISMQYSTVVHLCACGCKREITTPLSPLDWSMTYNGKVISLHPSIGNWQFPCRSHYWIKENRIVWSGNMSNDLIERNRKENIALKILVSNESKIINRAETKEESTNINELKSMSLINRVKKWFGSLL